MYFSLRVSLALEFKLFDCILKEGICSTCVKALLEFDLPHPQIYLERRPKGPSLLLLIPEWIIYWVILGQKGTLQRLKIQEIHFWNKVVLVSKPELCPRLV